jgi:hypothetical protein
MEQTTKDKISKRNKEWWANHKDFKPRKGFKISQETKEKMRQAKLGKKRKPFTQEHKDKLKKILDEARILAIDKAHKEAMPDRFCIECGIKMNKYNKNDKCKDCNRKFKKQYRIDNNLNKSREYHLIRESKEFKDWRDYIFTTDDWVCQKTGQRGGELEPHHILNFSQHPEERFNPNNGITLSKKAHREFHKIYGQKNNTLEQIKEFCGIMNT